MTFVSLHRIVDHMGIWYQVAWNDKRGNRWIKDFRSFEEALKEIREMDK